VLRKKLLLVSPAFHTYYSGIAAALAAQGFDVTVHLYDQAASTLDSLKNRIAVNASGNLATGIREGQSQAAATALRTSAPDAVVVVKGDTLTDTWWSALAESKAASWLWIYDDLSNTKFDTAFLKTLPAVASYSKADTRVLRESGIAAAFVPGGFDASETYQAQGGLSGTVTFTGARYPERERILSGLAANGIDVKAFGREWSRAPIDVLRTQRWRAASFPAGPDLPRAKSYGVMAGSLASVNHHGGHDGFNMRLFEACGVGGAHIVDRSDVSDFYEIGSEVLTYSDIASLTDVVGRLAADPAFASEIRAKAQRRTLAEHTLAHRMADLLAMRDYASVGQSGVSPND
jgi:spore maturation protein CgeB